MEKKSILLKVIVALNLILGHSSLPSPTGNADMYPVGDPRRCTSLNSDRILRFEVLPGAGWDNLRNKEMGILTNFNYTQCRTTEDGKFLIPDGIFAIPIKSSKIETYAELITHWDNFTSTLSKGVNVNAGLHFSENDISGKFSDEYMSVKSNQHLDKSMTTRVQVRYVQYTAKLEPDTKINEVFKARLRKIAAHLLLNHTDRARYESQLLVRDFGTHVITGIDVGAALVQVDEIDSTYVQQTESQKQQILASASASFFKVFDFGVDYSQATTSELIDSYLKSRTTSKTLTFGGPVLRPNNFTANNWSSSIYNNMVALDRNGDPIYYQISDVNLPNVSQSTVYDVYDYVKDAVHLYYEHNTYRGCTNVDSPNFSFHANVDDGTCIAPLTNFTFGGVYQTCTGNDDTDLCSGMIQKNPLTGDFSCLPGYEPVSLQQGTKTSYQQRQSCHRCWLIFHCCDTVTDTDQATYSAFWCAATSNIKPNTGFLFGGPFTSTMTNVLTQSQSCPREFYPLKLLEILTICVSVDYDLGFRYSLPFAGFHSCKAGNPLVLKEQYDLLQSSGRTSIMMTYMKEQVMTSYPHSCPKGYSQHLAIVDDDCNIYYCFKTGALFTRHLPKVRRPPFMDAPKDVFSNIYTDNIVLSSDGTLWRSMEAADAVVPTFMAQNGMFRPTTVTSAKKRGSSGLSGGDIAAISISAIVACVLMGTIVFLTMKRRRRQRVVYSKPYTRYGEEGSKGKSCSDGYSNITTIPIASA